MNYQEIQAKIQEIESAIENNNYTVTYCEPSNVVERTTLTGNTFYVVTDNDGPRGGNDFGSCTIHVAGISVTCDWGTGECSSTFFDQLADKYLDEYGDKVTRDEIIEEIQDQISCAEGFLLDEYTDTDSQIEAYEQATGKTVDDYYWVGDDDMPMSQEDFTPIDQCELETLEVNGKTYYIVDDDDDEEVLAVAADAKPDDDGCYPVVAIDTETDEVDDDYPDVYDSTNGEFC